MTGCDGANMLNMWVHAPEIR